MPLSVFDSWGFLDKATQKLEEASFVSEFQRMINISLKARDPIFLNVYFDPSHVVEYGGFKECLSFLHKMSNKIWIGRYSDTF